MNFTAPDIVIFEDKDDPLSVVDVAKEILSRAWLQHKTMALPTEPAERQNALAGWCT